MVPFNPNFSFEVSSIQYLEYNNFVRFFITIRGVERDFGRVIIDILCHPGRSSPVWGLGLAITLK